jgi:hypothetical protein
MSTNTIIKKSIINNKKSIEDLNLNVDVKSSTYQILQNTFSKFFTNLNDKIFKDIGKSTEGSDFKKELKIYLIIFLTIFLTLFLIFTVTTSMVTIQYYEEICSNNKKLIDDMTFIYRLAILNRILIVVFIGLFASLNLITKGLINEKYINIINDWKIIYWLGLLISSINMFISSKLIINISKCNFDTYYLYYYLWINHAITLPICLLILILNIFYNKIYHLILL